MLLPLLFLVSAASAPKVPDNAPITVTGHAWAPFISPMGEPFRARTLSEDTLALWFVQADRNRDGAITLDEMQADADRFFARLDEDHNGEIEPEELIRYEWEIAPDIQVNSRVKRAPGEVAAKPRRSRPEDDDRPIVRAMDKGLQGGARYALLNIPEPVAAADTDFNRGITRAEFRAAATARFQLLDSSHHGRLTLPELRALRFALRGARSRKDEADTRYGSPLPRAD